MQETGATVALSSSFFDAANKAEHFRDLLFALVPAASISLSTTIEYLCSHRDRGVSLLTVIGLILNILILLSGFVGFLVIPDDQALGRDLFALYSKLIILGLVISLVSELWTSVSGENLRRRNDQEVKRVKIALAKLRAKGRK
jgi:uncharacterized membrane protein